jgi:L-seryl-tRNA(Ser) seleniumtransferase
MPLPPWATELLRRSISDVAARANPETIDKIKSQIKDAVEQIPSLAARGIDTLMQAGQAGRESVRQWARSHTAISVPFLNATGKLIHDNTNVPLSAGVIGIGLDFIDGTRMPGPGFETLRSRAISQLNIKSSLGSFDFAVANHFSTAIAAIPCLIGDQKLVLHRSQAHSLANQSSVPDLIASLGFSFTEVGSIDAMSADDFQGYSDYATVAVDGKVAASSLGTGLKINVLPIATALQNTHSIASIEQSIADGYDIVITTPRGLMAGPSTGLIVGNADAIEKLKSHRLWRLLEADLANFAMTTKALAEACGAHWTAGESDTESNTAADSLPIRLLGVAEENLRSRADRMALRFGGDDSVASVRVTDRSATFDGSDRCVIPSRQVNVRLKGETAEQTIQRWSKLDTAILVTRHDDEVSIDLRWIPAARDIELAEAILPTNAKEPSDSFPKSPSDPSAI